MASLDSNILITMFSALVLPLIVAVNIWDRKAPSSPLSAYMWREEPLVWMLGLVFLSLLSLFSIVDLASRFGWLPADVASFVMPVFGVPVMALALAVLVLGSRAVLRAVRARQKT